MVTKSTRLVHSLELQGISEGLAAANRLGRRARLQCFPVHTSSHVSEPTSGILAKSARQRGHWDAGERADGVDAECGGDARAECAAEATEAAQREVAQQMRDGSCREDGLLIRLVQATAELSKELRTCNACTAVDAVTTVRLRASSEVLRQA
jgi:hypothetical protein